MPPSRTLSNSLSVSVGVQTHPGRERMDNQDRVTRSATPYGDLFVLADGVGGYEGGAEAAQTVVDGYAAYLNQQSELPLDELLQRATDAINSELTTRLAASSVQHGLGSTVVLCVLYEQQVTYGHVGDSRIYLARDRRLTQLTRDHSAMERMISQGILSPEMAGQHPDASALTRAFGLVPEISLDIATIEVRPGDALLLCSDGLWAYAPHAEMEAVTGTESLSAPSVAEALLKLALEGGGGDNVSIQYIQIAEADPAPFVQQPKRPSRRLSAWTKYALLALAVVLASGALGLFIWNQQHPLLRQAAAVLPQAVQTAEDAATSAAGAVSRATKQAPTPSTSPASGSPQTGRAPVVVIETTTRNAAQWADRLSGLNYLQMRRETGSVACLALRRSAATLFYLHERRNLAIRVQQDLVSSHIQIAELSPSAEGLCGGGDMIALPSSSAAGHGIVGTVRDKARSRIESVTQSTRDQIERQIP